MSGREDRKEEREGGRKEKNVRSPKEESASQNFGSCWCSQVSEVIHLAKVFI